MAIYELGERVPQIDPSAYVFDTATVIGNVILGARVSIWPYVTLRGDNEPIEIGDDSNVQESCVLHADPGFLDDRPPSDRRPSSDVAWLHDRGRKPDRNPVGDTERRGDRA